MLFPICARPDSVQVQLLANGEAKGDAVTLDAANNWSHTWTELPEKANGQTIAYTVKEVGEENNKITFNGKEYSVQITGSAEAGYTVTNSYTPGKVNVPVTKAWNDGNNQDGVRPDSVQVQLLANGEANGDAVTLNEGNSWSHTWENLPEKANGQAIAYMSILRWRCPGADRR